jgi:hypothetical protein
MTRHLTPAQLIHEDRTNYTWTDAQLDTLLEDPEVREASDDVLLAGFDEDDVFSPEPVYAACRARYRRREAAALLFHLAYRRMQVLCSALSAGGAQP